MNIQKITKKNWKNMAKKKDFFSDAVFEITTKCNFNCLHCYNDERNLQTNTEYTKKIIDELKKLGVVYITLTGGEPLIRNDFEEIYIYLKQNGFIVSIFTNSVLLLKYQEVLLKYPPYLVSVSLYGITDDEHNEFTQTKKQLGQVSKSLDWLKENNINFEIKGILNRKNFQNILEGKYDDFALQYEKKIQFDYEIFPTKSGDSNVVEYRVSSSQIRKFLREKYFTDLQFKKEYKLSHEKGPIEFTCHAGETFLSINASGEFSVCQKDFNSTYLYSNNIDFIIQKLKERKMQIIEINSKRKCSKCNVNSLCSGACYLEASRSEKFLCKIHKNF